MSHLLKSALFGVMCLAISSLSFISAEEPSGQILGGSLNAPIRIEVFSDFQCPHCRDLFLDTIRPVLKDYASKDKVCVIYHEFPLSNHQYSREAARYVEAAAQLGQQKLLPVYESIFKDQAEWSVDGKLEDTIAKALPHDDLLKVIKAMQDPGINAAIEKEIDKGVKNKIESTPTMIISYVGKQQRVEGLVTYPVLKQFIDSVVK